MILVCYDGSPHAAAAIDRAGALMPGAEVTVLSIWEPYADLLARTGAMGAGFSMAGVPSNMAEIDAAAEQAATVRADDGVVLADEAGLVARPAIAPSYGSVPDVILATAAELDADAIVVGTRGLSGLRSMLLGSVSHAVLQHADRPVIVVPSPVLAADRRRHVRELRTPA